MPIETDRNDRNPYPSHGIESLRAGSMTTNRHGRAIGGRMDGKMDKIGPSSVGPLREEDPSRWDHGSVINETFVNVTYANEFEAWMGR
jgi:hypothetical protein